MTNKKVLVVEDEEALLDILSEELEGKNVEVLKARNGQEGLEAALKEHPDLIILDLLMPKMDGLTMLKKLREDSWGQTAAALILTNADNDVEKTIEAVQNDVYEYLVKSRWTLKDVAKRAKEKLSFDSL